MPRRFTALWFFVGIILLGSLVFSTSLRGSLFGAAGFVNRTGRATQAGIARLVGVRQELEWLRHENALLRQQQQSRLEPPARAGLVPAELIFIDRIALWPTRLVLKRTDASPLEAGDFIVTEGGDGLVGRVTLTQGPFAAVSTVFSSDLELLVIGVESGATGATAGSDLSGSFLKVRSARDAAAFKPGEIVVSAGVGAFPRGLRVGAVSTLRPPSGEAFTITLLAPSFSSALTEPLFVLPRASLPQL